MSFWNLSSGEAVNATGEYEAPSGGLPIPDNTDVMSYIDEVKWDEKNGARYISVRWRVAKPEGFKNRVVFQKLWVLGNNPKKTGDKLKQDGDKAKRMLAAIDANAGGELMAVNGIPSDEDLQRCLMNKMMVIKVKTYDLKGDDGSAVTGNWVASISPASKGVSDAPAPAQPRREPDRAANGTARYDDSDIPF